MDDFLLKTFDMVMTHGQYSLPAVFLLIIMYLYKANNDLKKQLDRKDNKIFKLIDDYKNGTITTTQALSEIKNVLVEIKIKL